MLVVAPVEIGVHHGRFHGVWGRVERVHAGNVVRALEPVRVEAFIAVDVAFDSFRVGVEQQLVRVAAQTLHRVVRAVHTVAVTLPRLDSGQIVVPDVRVLLGHFDSSSGCLPHRKDKARPFVPLGGKEGKIHAGAVIACAERIHRSGLDLHDSSISRFSPQIVISSLSGDHFYDLVTNFWLYFAGFSEFAREEWRSWNWMR